MTADLGPVRVGTDVVGVIDNGGSEPEDAISNTSSDKVDVGGKGINHSRGLSSAASGS